MKSIKVCEYSRSRSFHYDLILQDQASGEHSQDQWSSGLVYCAMNAMRFCHLICMYVFQAIRTCGFWKEHNTLFNSKRSAKIDSFDTILYMYVAVLLVFD